MRGRKPIRIYHHRVDGRMMKQSKRQLREKLWRKLEFVEK